MKNQALFSSKDKSKKIKCRLQQFLFGALRINLPFRNVPNTASSVTECRTQTLSPASSTFTFFAAC